MGTTILACSLLWRQRPLNRETARAGVILILSSHKYRRLSHCCLNPGEKYIILLLSSIGYSNSERENVGTRDGWVLIIHRTLVNVRLDRDDVPRVKDTLCDLVLLSDWEVEYSGVFGTPFSDRVTRRGVVVLVDPIPPLGPHLSRPTPGRPNWGRTETQVPVPSKSQRWTRSPLLCLDETTNLLWHM